METTTKKVNHLSPWVLLGFVVLIALAIGFFVAWTNTKSAKAAADAQLLAAKAAVNQSNTFSGMVSGIVSLV